MMAILAQVGDPWSVKRERPLERSAALTLTQPAGVEPRRAARRHPRYHGPDLCIALEVIVKLTSLACPKCRSLLIAEDGTAVKAERFEDCLRRCEPCGVGWSNGAANPRRIWRDPLDNVPDIVRPGLLEAVAMALNVLNRERKRVKLASERSEDALTWTVMQYLSRHSVGDAHWQLLTGFDPPMPTATPTILVWGVPVAGARGGEVRAAVEVVLDALGESANSRTEPDVILDFGPQGIVVIEVKYRSGNDRQDDKPWSRYVADASAFLDRTAAQESGRYELARNWRVACDLAGKRPMTLVNLVAVPETGADRDRTDRFAGSLRLEDQRRFVRLSLAELLAAVPEPRPTWFATYIHERGLVHTPDASLGEA